MVVMSVCLTGPSLFKATVGTQQRFYVAAQGPQTNTLASFWQMVWEADIYLVVNLLGANEDGAIPYLPTNIADRSLDLGDVSSYKYKKIGSSLFYIWSLLLSFTHDNSVPGVVAIFSRDGTLCHHQATSFSCCYTAGPWCVASAVP